MTSTPRSGLLTIADLDDFPENDGHRYELIDGELFVSASPYLRHQWLQMNLIHLLHEAGPDDLAVLAAPVGVELGIDTHLEPDLLVVPRSAMTPKALVGRPVLVIEILSPSSHRYDRVRKRDAYQRMGIPSYWIADPEEPSVTALELHDGEYQEIATARGDNTFTVERPFSLSLVPEELVAL
jgi:Uma2 family endonuclease